MKKLLAMFISTVVVIGALSGCVQEPPKAEAPKESMAIGAEAPKESTATGAEAPKESTATGAEAPKESMPAGADTAKMDATTAASPKESSDPAKIKEGLSAKGYWIFAVLSDITIPDEIVVDGEFHDKGDAKANVYRKFSLYAQDKDHKVTARYTVTVPKMTVKSPNFRIQEGTLKGDVYVEANGFELKGSKIDGNLIFKTKEFQDSAKLQEGTVTGKTSVG